MEKEVKIGIHNKFEFVRRDAKTGEVLGEYKAENMILNNFWAAYLNVTNYHSVLNYIHFGSGTASPVVTDVKLTTWIGYKATVKLPLDFTRFVTEGIILCKRSIRLEDTEFVGSMISEVGFSSGTSGTTGLCTKALIKDSNGNPISIEKKTGEIIDIYATVYLNLGLSQVDGAFRFGTAGSSFDQQFLSVFTMENFAWGFSGMKSFGYSNIAQPFYTNMPTQNGVTVTPVADVPNRKITYTIPNAVAAAQNYEGGIRCLTLAYGASLKLPCTGFAQPVLTKEVVGTGDGATKDFNTKFGWIKNNGTFRVYVNDVEVPATCDYNQGLPRTNIILDMKPIDWNKDATVNPYLGTNPNYIATGGWVIFENPYYLSHPISSMTYQTSYFTMQGSNDLETWTTAGAGSYRYWKITCTNGGARTFTAVNSTSYAASKLIHLTSAPAVGDTVSVTYQPDVIAKDDQHVLNNVSIAFTFNEYTP